MGSLTPEEISRLTVAEKLELIGDLWDSIDHRDIALTPAQMAELDRRLETFDEDIKTAISWEEFEAKLDARTT
jgi:putative addiction module component (TIGR02574 family)